MGDPLAIAAWYDNNPVVQGITAAAFERGVAAGRRQAAHALTAIFEKKAAEYRRLPGNWATACDWDVAAMICEDHAAGAPAEPVEEDTDAT